MPDACDPDTDYQRTIIDSDVYTAYQIVFCVLALGVAAWCLRPLVEYVRRQKSLTSMRYQVILCLLVYSLARAVLFALGDYEFGCSPQHEIEASLHTVKDVAWVTAFCIVIVFWFELQRYAAAAQGVNRLRPVLGAVVVVFASLRVMQQLLQYAVDDEEYDDPAHDPNDDTVLGDDGADADSGYQVGLWAVTALLIMFYIVLFCGAQYSGVKLLQRLQGVAKHDTVAQYLSAKLRKLTTFIFKESLLTLVFMAVYAVKSSALVEKEESPELYFALKVVEKCLEMGLSVVLVLMMTSKDSTPSSRAAAAPAASTLAAPAPAPARALAPAPGSLASRDSVQEAMEGGNQLDPYLFPEDVSESSLPRMSGHLGAGPTEDML